MAGLLEFWDAAKREPFVWGQNDCALWVTKYVEAKTGNNPAADVYGKYSTAFGYRRYIMGMGGLLAAGQHFMKDYPAGDDVGIFEVNGHRICGIKKGGAVALKSKNGLSIVKDAKLIQGWAI